jgi:hypothetical protein
MNGHFGSKRMSDKQSEKIKKQSLKEKKSSDEFLGMTHRISIDNIEKHFPTLYNEISDKQMSLNISEVKTGFESTSKEGDDSIDEDPLRNYEPDVYDFLARSKTSEEGIEIIRFLENKGQISPRVANEFREKLKKEGIRSFGPLRGPDHYFRKAAEIRDRRVIKKRYSYRNDDNSKK